MIIRKEFRALTATEWLTFVNALLQLKKEGTYDEFVHMHHALMYPTVHPDEPQDPDYRNPAHRGPGFFPWHREFLLQFEAALMAINPSVALPYWDWTKDSAAPLNSPLWTSGYLGGNGDPTEQYRVQDGPFAYKYGNWDVPPYPDEGLPGPGLKRDFGVLVNSLPTPGDLQRTMAERIYDTPGYDSSPFTLGFRNRAEGWITKKGDPLVTTDGSQMHNRVHLWVGGSMTPMTSPDDPVFWLHHCFIDKIWADWQAQMMLEKPQWAPHYCPRVGGPPGHNLDDVLKPWTHTIKDVLDISSLGYAYAPSQPQVKSPFKSPFLA